MLELQFLGPLKIIVTGNEVEKFPARAKELLVYMALTKTPLNRSEMGNLFWPEKDLKQQQVNLRQAIAKLKEFVDEEKFLLINNQTIQLNWDADIHLDLDQFLETQKRGDIEKAGQLFKGELADGFTMLSDGPDKWLSDERTKIRGIALDIFSQFAIEKLEQADYPAAIDAARRQIELDRTRESAFIQLMQAYAYSGQKELAIKAFDELENNLAEIGISPSQEAFDLIRRIEKGEFGRAFGPTAPFMAPAVPDYFTGRDAEISALSDLLTGSTHKIVGLVGMGGIGKTTLATATAHHLKEQFPDGVLWGSLLNSSAENVLKLWGQAFGRDYSAISDLNNLAIAMRNTLADKKALLILDNVEDEKSLEPFLQTGEDIRLLLTTRDKDAAVAVNAEPVDVEKLSLESSLHLMEQILTRPNLAENEPAQEICKLLDNLPLAVEITAQLLKARPGVTLNQMLTRLQSAKRRLDLEIRKYRGVRSTFEVSWEVLNDTQKSLFSNVGIFEGRSFSLEAADSLVDSDQFDTEDNLHDLAALSLMKWDEEGKRFRQHPLLADFAREKLTDKTGTQNKLVEYYLNFAETNALNYEALTPEWDNLLAVILSLEELEGWEQVLNFTDLLHDSWFRFGRFRDANQIYPLSETAARNIGNFRKIAEVLLGWSEIGLEQNSYDSVWEKLVSAKELYLRIEEELGLAKVKFLQGQILQDQGEYEKAIPLIESCIKTYSAHSDEFNSAKAKGLLGWIFYLTESDLKKSMDLAEEASSVLINGEDSLSLLTSTRLKIAILIDQEKYVDATNLLVESKPKVKKTKSPTENVAFKYLHINLLRNQQIFDKATEISIEAIDLTRKLGMIRWEGMLLQQLAAIKFSIGEIKDSELLCKNMLHLFRQTEDRLNYAYTLTRLGEIYRALNQDEKSNSYFTEAKKIAEHLKNSHLISILKSLDQKHS